VRHECEAIRIRAGAHTPLGISLLPDVGQYLRYVSTYETWPHLEAQSVVLVVHSHEGNEEDGGDYYEAEAADADVAPRCDARAVLLLAPRNWARQILLATSRIGCQRAFWGWT
jgi:hypothetical protein